MSNATMTTSTITLSSFKGKRETVSIDKLVFKPELNPTRFLAGTVGGIAVKDTYNIEGMVAAIFEKRGIMEPLHVSKRADGNVVFRGNRRGRAAQTIKEKGVAFWAAKYGDEELAKEVVSAMDRIPAMTYESMTDEQILNFVNDQDQKRFSVSGLLNLVWALQATGKGFTDICMSYTEELSQATGGGRAKYAEICLLPAHEQAAAIKTWLKGTLDDIWLSAGKLGARVKRALFTKYLREDGLTDEKPEFKIDRGRLVTLRKSKDLDGIQWHPETGGPTFNAAIAKFIDEDKAGPTTPAKKKPDSKAVAAILDNAKSQAARTALFYSQGEPAATSELVQIEDDKAYRLELVQKEWLKLRDRIANADVKEALQAVFAGDPLQLELNLAKFM